MNPPDHTPLLVIGAGPGGYTAAFMAADLKIDVTLVDIKPNPGGICLFEGCIPTKALLHAVKIIADTKAAQDIGIEFKELYADPPKINRFKDDVVKKLTSGLGQLAKMRQIRYIRGRAEFLNSSSVKISSEDGSGQELSFDQAIIATGSQSVHLPFEPPSDLILDSTTALNIQEIPKTLLIVGGGYIGLEFATIYSELGCHVTVAEMLPQLLPQADHDLVAILQKRLELNLAGLHTATSVREIKGTAKGLSVKLEDKDGNIRNEGYEKILMAVGRKPLTQGLNLEKTSVELTPNGFIKVNDQRRTSDPKIYAIGDVAGQPMLAHKAAHEARVAARVIAGQDTAFHPSAIPSVIYTNPEMAWCGLTETEAKEKSRDIKTLKFPWMASGRAVTLNRTEGLTKLIVDAQDGKLLGMGIIGESAGEMIAEGLLAMQLGATARDIMHTIHPHPTLSETIMEAAEIYLGQSTHIFRRQK